METNNGGHIGSIYLEDSFDIDKPKRKTKKRKIKNG